MGRAVMATVQPNRATLQTRVRPPLQTLRKHIRAYGTLRADALLLSRDRRCPRERGAGLSAAVEMAAPNVAEKSAHSQEMSDVTVAEAARRVETLPVRDVFNWGRLYKQWAGAVGLTFGIY